MDPRIHHHPGVDDSRVLDEAHLLDPAPVVRSEVLDAVPPIVSVDDHVVEPAHVFDAYLDPAWRSHAVRPRLVRRRVASLGFQGGTNYDVVYTDDTAAPAADCWVFDGQCVAYKRNIAAVGYPREQMTLEPATFESMRPGCFDPVARLADMDLNGVEASLCFPTMARFAGQTFSLASDKALALECLRAWNRWILEEWSGTDRTRLVPLGLVPLWDPARAALEAARLAARGVRAVAFPELVHNFGFPSLHSGAWDPFFAVCAAEGMAVCCHIGTGNSSVVSSDAPPAVQAALSSSNSQACLVDFVLSGVLERFPDLQLSLAEGQIGWVPFCLERMDDVWREHRAWGGVAGTLSRPPSQYWHRQVYGCFFRDPHGVENLDRIGVDRVTFETDYPHTDSTWPHTRAWAAAQLGHLPAEQLEAVLRGNARRMLGLDG